MVYTFAGKLQCATLPPLHCLPVVQENGKADNLRGLYKVVKVATRIMNTTLAFGAGLWRWPLALAFGAGLGRWPLALAFGAGLWRWQT